MKEINLSVTAPKPETVFASTKNKLKTLTTSFADIHIDTECCEEESVSKEDLENMAEMLFSNLDYIYSLIGNLSERIWKTEDKCYEIYYKHLQGHLPPILSVEQLQKAIDTLGIGGDYEVQKKTIYASDGSVEKLVLEIPIK